METLEIELKKVKQRELEILKAIDMRNEQRTIPCACCNIPYAINTLTAVQTRWTTYADGHGNGGDVVDGELQFVCPTTGNINRLLFDNTDVPWIERRQYANNPEDQFTRIYRKLFKEVINASEETEKKKHVNNYYVDAHRAEYGLVEKRQIKPQQ
ncbi:hypothetical protein JW756_00135 [Candidatus Woesearchaeota archaeon]|nr:hypothetical protein [Candidatus Woesearchaeota archaeon]